MYLLLPYIIQSTSDFALQRETADLSDFLPTAEEGVCVFQKLEGAYPDPFSIFHPGSVLIKELIAPYIHARW